ncbi:hypothetical protein M2138_001764 [Dysgonomonadaceae bacterium PH5-43]|nr:hypothetical protein [Dysgonomonadaceae bacterium PH5-43]
MRKKEITLRFIMVIGLSLFTLSLWAQTLTINNWEFKYETSGTGLTLTEVVTSGNEFLEIPSSVTVDEQSFTIVGISKELFKDNLALERMSIPASFINTTWNTFVISDKPQNGSPIALGTEQTVIDTDQWTIEAVVNTGGKALNQWGTALLATGVSPIENSYPNGFQIWADNGTDNNSGNIKIKYGGSTQVFDNVKLLPGGTNDITISLTYNGTKYIATVSTDGNTSTKEITLGYKPNFTHLSSAISSEGTFSELEIYKTVTRNFLDESNSKLKYITVHKDNPMWSSNNGSLYNKAGNKLFLDLSAVNTPTEEVITIDNWSFNYETLGKNLILTNVVTSGNTTLTIPATVDINNVTYTIKALKENLFKDNTTLKHISIPASVVSLGSNSTTESYETLAKSDFPLTLTNPIVASDEWKVKAIVSTAGEYGSNWGTALLATGSEPVTTEDFTGGFQIWLNNGTNNSEGTIVHKYGSGTSKETFSDDIIVKNRFTDDIALEVSYSGGFYNVAVAALAKKLIKFRESSFDGFNILSTSITSAGKVSQLEISKFSFPTTPTSLSLASTLESITIDAENTKYYSLNGNLYDEEGTLLLARTSIWNGNESTDWTETSNWEAGVAPTELSSVIISANTSNVVTIPSGITIAKLTMKEGAKAIVNGSITVSGSINVEVSPVANRWYPVGFPFEISGVYHYGFEEGEELLIPYEASTGGDYWLKKYEEEEFKYTQNYSAGNGYIIQYPEYFSTATLPVIYTSTSNITLNVSSEATIVPSKDNSYELKANPTLNTITVKSENETYYYKYEANGNLFRRVENNATAEIAPFESVVVVKKASVLKSIISDGDLTNLEDVNISNDEVVRTQYFNLQGVEIKEPSDKKAGVIIVKQTMKSGIINTIKEIK